jgi:plastocyanin
MSSLRPLRQAGVALMALALLGACGSDDGASDATTTTTASTDGAATGASRSAVDCSGADGATVTVEIGDFEFLPDPVSVSACDEIVWRNVHDQAHTSTGSGEVTWSTGNIAPGADADPIVFDTPGEHAYMCALHPFMKGVVEVS